MRILVINCGSASLKYDLIDTDAANASLESGSVEALHRSELIELLQHMSARIDAVGHRVVHGADRFVEPTLIDEYFLEELGAVSELAPLHNAPSLEFIRLSRKVLGEAVPMVAVFDTAFHRNLPPEAAEYGIPAGLARKHRIRRYGFHGLAHRYMLERYCELTGRPKEQVRLITLQLGGGCSAAAIRNGRSVDTTMGFTPLEGLLMGTRCGDLDPAIPGYLARQEDVPVEEVERWLNHRSGLLGVSETSNDMRRLLEAEQRGDHRAATAIAIFCYRIRKAIGAYLAALGGADAVVFGGGIGENSPEVRERVCGGMEWCGLTLDGVRNRELRGAEARISSDAARLEAWVIPAREAVVIAADSTRVLAGITAPA